MITIIEGTDGVGKSTFADWLGLQTNTEVIHKGAPTQANWYAEYIEPLLGEGDLILDRWHLGEMIWPQYFNRNSLFENYSQFRECNKLLDRLNTKLIIVYRDPADIIETLLQRGEDDQISIVLEAQMEYINAYEHITDINTELINSNDLRKEMANAH